MSFPPDLIHFVPGEFRHPELMDPSFLYFLDAVRTRYGAPLIITSDARTPEENAAATGSSPNSLHLLGRAVDLHWITDRAARWVFVGAVYATADALGLAPELELVNGPTDHHIHLGLFPPGHMPALEVAAT